MKEQAIDSVRAGGVEVAKDYRAAMEAMTSATQCARCRTRKTTHAGWTTSITRTKTRGVRQRHVEVLCPSCQTRHTSRRSSSRDSARDRARRRRLEIAERESCLLRAR
jgi:hypothetical protein